MRLEIFVLRKKNRSNIFWTKQKSWSKNIDRFFLSVENFLVDFFWTRKNFRPKKISVEKKKLIEKKVGRKKIDRKQIIENQSFFDVFFSIKKFATNFFSSKNVSIQKIFFDKNVLGFFSTKNCRIKKCWLPIPIRNFPKIPKIILRTACDHYKNTNNAHEKKLPFCCSTYHLTPSDNRVCH